MPPDARRHTARAFDSPREAKPNETGTSLGRLRGGFTAREEDTFDLTCRASPTVVGQVRLTLGLRMVQWARKSRQLVKVSDDLRLIASELITNAIEQTPDMTIRIQCAPDRQNQRIRFAVWDSSTQRPGAQMPELDIESLDLSPERFDDNGGWGLPVVQELAEACGITPTEHGKWVWAVLKVGD